jgi:hypothetical protein
MASRDALEKQKFEDDDFDNTSKSPWWAIGECCALALVAIVAGIVIYRMRDEDVRVPPNSAVAAPAVAPNRERLLIDFATDSDLVILAKRRPVRELLIEDSTITDAGLAYLEALAELEHLRIRGAAITDVGIRSLCRLSNLRVLNLPHAQFSDVGLAELVKLPNLELLRFGSPAVSDAGMAYCRTMPKLRFLHLIDVPISDQGLLHLRGMAQLESLYVDGADLSDAAVEALLTDLPNLHLHIDQQHHDRDPHKNDHEHDVRL